MIFGGASTFSKMHCNYPDGFPEYFECCEGQYLIDNSRNRYFDTVSALGAQLIDYRNGGMMSLPCSTEKELAEILKQKMPFIEMVRYGNNGADTSEGALRYARAHTGKKWILSYGYHSCQSAFTNQTPPALGCVEGFIRQFETLDLLLSWMNVNEINDIAGIIVEPVILDLNVKRELETLRKITAQKGIVLIFDEIITGFRVPEFCISNWFKIFPDIILLGKGIGGGYPLSIIGGRKEIMNKPVFISYTFAGFPEAIDRALFVCTTSNDDILKLWETSGKFIHEFNEFSFGVKLKGYNTRCIWDGPRELVYTFWQEMLKKKVFLGPVFFPKLTWTEEIFKSLLITFSECIHDIKSNNITLSGHMPEPIFKRNT
jgi:glutamate-1-semialdehyde 2,1-aminomutase